MMRTPGRRYWESHWHFRLAGFIAICMLSVSVWFTYSRVTELQGPHNPHYNENQCFHCHEPMGTKMTVDKCFNCHDLHTRQLLPNALEDRKKMTGGKACSHPIRLFDRNGERTATQLCIGCHKAVGGYVAMMNISTKKYIEIDMSVTHPIGLMPTETVFPQTLPLAKQTGSINCVTCHDQHATDRRLRMLRLYYPGNGHPPDFRPLCNDCHADGWLPLRKERADVVREVPRQRKE